MASDFGEALSRGLTGRGHVDPTDGYPVLLAELARLAGSKAAAARELGVSPTTFYRWVSGRSSRPGGRPQQPKVAKSTLVKMIRSRQLDPALAAAVRHQTRKLKISGTITVSQDTRHRTIHPGRDFPPRARVQARLLDAWLAGDDDKAEDITMAGIDRWYAPGMNIETVTTVEWEQ